MVRLPTPEQIARMQANPNDSLVTNIRVCTIICGVVATLTICLRIISNRLSGRRNLLLSDWLIIIAWVLFIVFDVCFALTTVYGGGRHIIYVTNPRMLQIINITNENTYCYSMAFIKFSILSLYKTIFPQPKFHYCLLATGIFVALWAISCGVVAIVQCTPIEFGWNPTLPGGHCINYGLLVLIAGILNIITDLTIFGLPIPLVLKLNLTKQKKRLIIFTFMIGASACIVSIVRLAYTLPVGTTADGSWDMMPAGMLSTVELMAGLLAASIPRYRPLFRRLFSNKEGSSKGYAYPLSAYVKRGASNQDTMPPATEASHMDNLGDVSERDDIKLITHRRLGGNWIQMSDKDQTQPSNPSERARPMTNTDRGD